MSEIISTEKHRDFYKREYPDYYEKRWGGNGCSCDIEEHGYKCTQCGAIDHGEYRPMSCWRCYNRGFTKI